ncbi:MAG: mandelate racemase/muconate lactonizing enzyme family protein [Verrucomicrobia bacterium]|nr:mandelate racemase/muconate lactonizing enzyme family protein [Verrucomicrobiota bacterium]
MTTRRTFMKDAMVGAAAVSAAMPLALTRAASAEARLPVANQGVKIKIVTAEPLLVSYPGGGLWVLTRIRTDQGVEGIGEGFCESAESGRAVRTEILKIAASLIGTNPLGINAFVQKFKPLGKGRFWTSAIAAMEIAMWDIAGKVAGKPIYDLLGGALRTRIPVYQTWGAFDLERSIEKMAAAKARGIQMLKCDPFVTLPWRTVGERIQDLPRSEDIKATEKYLTRLRNVLGEDYKIGCDGHWRMSVEGAKQMAKAMEPFKPVFFEEPTTRPDDPDDLKAVAASTSIPISTGEHFETIEQAANAVASGVLSFIQPEVAWNCGILETLKMTSLAEGMGIRIATHGHVSPVAIRAASHINAVIPNLFFQEHPASSWQSWPETLFEPLDRLEDGHVILSDAPGLGMKLNEAELKKRLIA